MWLHSSVGRASHRYRGGHGFESRWSLDFLQASSFQLLKLENLLRWSFFTLTIYYARYFGLKNKPSTGAKRKGKSCQSHPFKCKKSFQCSFWESQIALSQIKGGWLCFHECLFLDFSISRYDWSSIVMWWPPPSWILFGHLGWNLALSLVESDHLSSMLLGSLRSYYGDAEENVD